MLTRDEMASVIQNGGSVLFQSRVISRVEDLPTPAEIGVIDPSQATKSLADLESARKAIDDQIAAMKVAEAASKTQPRNVEKTDDEPADPATKKTAK